MERRRRGITQPGVYPRERWYQLGEEADTVSWLADLGTQPYLTSAGLYTSAACTVTLVPYESVIVASWQKGRASWRAGLDELPVIRVDQARSPQSFIVPERSEVIPCRPQAKSIVDDDEPKEKREKGTPQPYNSVFTQAQGPKGVCQLRFIRQNGGVIRVTIEALGTARWR